MKKSHILIPALAAFLVISCKEKDETTGTQSFFPALSFIKSQVAHVDTSLYSIIRVREIDSTRTDTTYIPREEFRGLAKDFLELPDITDKKLYKLYTEERIFDETLNTVILTYLPKDPEKVTIQRQEVLIKPDPAGDKVKSIIIDYLVSNRDSSVQKKLLWQADRSFQVVTMRQQPGQPETTDILKLIWDDQGN